MEDGKNCFLLEGRTATGSPCFIHSFVWINGVPSVILTPDLQEARRFASRKAAKRYKNNAILAGIQNVRQLDGYRAAIDIEILPVEYIFSPDGLSYDIPEPYQVPDKAKDLQVKPGPGYSNDQYGIFDIQAGVLIGAHDKDNPHPAGRSLPLWASGSYLGAERARLRMLTAHQDMEAGNYEVRKITPELVIATLQPTGNGILPPSPPSTVDPLQAEAMGPLSTTAPHETDQEGTGTSCGEIVSSSSVHLGPPENGLRQDISTPEK